MPPTTRSTTAGASGERLDREVQALALVLVADEDRDGRVIREAQLAAHLGTVGRVARAEPIDVDAVRDDGDRRAHPPVDLAQQHGLLPGEGDDRAVRAAPVADAVAEGGEQVHRIAHHPPAVVAPGAHRGLQQAVVDVDVAGHDVVVADRDRVGALREEPPRSPGANRAEPQHVAGAREVRADRGCDARPAGTGRRRPR